MHTTIQPMDHPVIVHFLHPGGEFHVPAESGDKKVCVPWVGDDDDIGCGKRDDMEHVGGCGGNADNKHSAAHSGHSRRLVKQNGQFVDENGRLQSSQLAVWAEWEGRTVAERMPLPASAEDRRLFAVWVHTPQSPLKGRIGSMNTDPCIFGSTFKYCNCQQHRNNEHTPYVTRRLSPGSLILFGSCLGRKPDTKFALDTVFVTAAEGIRYGNGTATEINVSKEYRKLSLERVWGGDYTFYRGRPFDSVKGSSFYSFSPARIFDGTDSNCGKRFILDLAAVNRFIPQIDKHFNPNRNRGVRPIDVGASVIVDVWQEIVRQVRAAGFVPGVHFGWPK